MSLRGRGHTTSLWCLWSILWRSYIVFEIAIRQIVLNWTAQYFLGEGAWKLTIPLASLYTQSNLRSKSCGLLFWSKYSDMSKEDHCSIPLLISLNQDFLITEFLTLRGLLGLKLHNTSCWLCPTFRGKLGHTGFNDAIRPLSTPDDNLGLAIPCREVRIYLTWGI